MEQKVASLKGIGQIYSRLVKQVVVKEKVLFHILQNVRISRECGYFDSMGPLSPFSRKVLVGYIL